MNQEVLAAPVAVTAVEQQQPRWRQMLAAGALAGSLLLAACSGNNGDTSPDTTLAPDRAVQVDQACGEAGFETLSNNAEKYVSEAFLPKTDKFENTEDGQKYLNTVFNDGPLGTTIDVESAAAVQAAIVVAANDGAAQDLNYSYVNTFKNKVEAYRAPGGLEAAKEDCSRAYATLTQTAEYNANWAQAGEQVTEIRALRGEGNNIVGMELAPIATQDTLDGIEFKLRESSKDIDGFTDVLWTADGRMFVKGVSAASINLSEGQPVDAAPEEVSEDQDTNNDGQNDGQDATGGSNNANQPNGQGPNGQGPRCGEPGTSDCEGPAGGQNPTTPGGTTPRPQPTVPPTAPPTTPRPTPPTVPPTTPPTVPPTTPPTTPPPTTPPTTTEPGKGPEVTIPGAPN